MIVSLGGLQAPCLVNSGPLHANWKARPSLLGSAPVFTQHTYPHLHLPRLPASSRCYTYLRLDENYHFCGTDVYETEFCYQTTPDIAYPHIRPWFRLIITTAVPLPNFNSLAPPDLVPVMR